MRALRFLGALCASLLLVCVMAASAKNVPQNVPQQKESADGLLLLNRTVSDVPITDCKRRDICDLKRLLFVSEDYRLRVGKDQYQYFTLAYATYETATFDTLEKYAFVQFIRGSAFTSRKDPVTGKTEVSYDGVLANFNQWLIYQIPSWIIDAKEASPVYMSVEGMSRHYWYRWQKDILPPPWLSQDENIYRNKKDSLSAPRLYVDDDPQAAFVSNDVAYNVSLEFKTCLYKSADIPVTTTRNDTNFAEPLFCFPWRSSFVYNHDLQKFESPTELVFPETNGSPVLRILGDKQRQVIPERGN